MKLAILIFLCLPVATNVSVPSPVSWNYFAKKLDEKTFELHLVATLEKSWYTYSQSTPQGGPLPTKISFDKNPLINILGATQEIGQLEKQYDSVFDVDVKAFSQKIDFVQMVQLKANTKTSISGLIEFMACNGAVCLPPRKLTFTIVLE